VLNKMGNLGGLFDRKNGHPLANPRELQQIVSELPRDNAFKSLDEIGGWLESLAVAEGFPADRLFVAASQLEDAATPHLRRLSREYLHTIRLSKAEERRLWAINAGFWRQLAEVYEKALLGLIAAGPTPEALRLHLPGLCARLIAALRAQLKWEQFHYGPTPPTLWARLGAAMQRAEECGVATRLSNLGGLIGSTSPLAEYRKAMVFHAASMDSLLPLEIELAERFIAHYLMAFDFPQHGEHDCVYWVDLALAQPPLRLARMPAEATPTLRFFRPGRAHREMAELLQLLERGSDVPADIMLGGQYPAKTLIPVLRHLCAYLAPIPPQRRHDRHRVKHRLSVMSGLVNAYVVFSGEFGGRPAGLQIESWVVENVSRGGFGAYVNSIPGEWLKVGALLALQPEGGENWVLGCVRRYHRESEDEARVGIETLARSVVAVELKPKMASSYAAVGGIPALLLEEGNAPGELRVVLPPYTFDPREALEFVRDGKPGLLEPLLVIEQTNDYELARYRVLPG
jgi:hypothetical protein